MTIILIQGILKCANNGRSMLHTISLNNSIEVFRYLVANADKSDLNELLEIKSNSGGTCCHEVVNNLDSISITEGLTKLLVKTSWLETDKSGYSSLHYAAQAGNIKAFKLLLESYSFDENELCMATQEGLTPLHLCYKEKHEVMIQFLLSLPNIDSSRLDKYGRKPIDL